MPDTETQEQIQNMMSPRWDDELCIRGSMCAALARGFSYPDEDTLAYLQECARETKQNDNREMVGRMRDLFEGLRSLSVHDLQQQHKTLFDSRFGPPLYEMEYREFADEFARAHELADIMGFYKAFGVQPTEERADHLSAELDFMHYLLVKEKYAQEKGQQENADVCRDAHQKFFTTHPEQWFHSLIRAVRESEAGTSAPFYTELAEILELFTHSQKEKVS